MNVNETEWKKPYLDTPRNPGELKSLVQKILNEWAITDYFVMITPGMGFTIYPDRKILAVGNILLSWAEPAVVSAILHEVGHIDRGHYLGEHDDVLLNYLDEYEADEFAWDALQTRYGQVPDSAGLWLLRYYGKEIFELDTWTHPSYQHRWERLAFNGYVSSDYYQQFQALGLETKGKKYAKLIGNHSSE